MCCKNVVETVDDCLEGSIGSMCKVKQWSESQAMVRESLMTPLLMIFGFCFCIITYCSMITYCTVTYYVHSYCNPKLVTLS